MIFMNGDDNDININNNSESKNNSESGGSLSNLFDKTYFSNINLIYYIDYLTYKKELIKNIYNDMDIIINFFNEEICDILIKILILKKKNKITENEFKLFESLYELTNLIEQINFFDQNEFLNLLLNFFEIKVFVDKIDIFFNKFQFSDLFDIKILTNGINEIYNKIVKNNLFLKTLFIIISTSNDNIASSEIKKLAKEISFDFFMYYNSLTLYEKIMKYLIKLSKKINIINQTLFDTNFNNDKNEKNKIYKFFKANKDSFLKEYDLYLGRHFEIYSNQEFELRIKFKLKNKSNINKFINDLKYISECSK